MADLEEDYGEDKLSEAMQAMEGLSIQEILEAGKKALFINLVVKVRANQASHQEANILKSILKDAGLLAMGISPETVLEAEKVNQGDAPVDMPDFDTPSYMQ